MTAWLRGAALPVLALGLAWPAAAAAQGERPVLPPPDLVPLVRLAAPALDKPAVPVPDVPLPAAPERLPELPAPPLGAGDPSLRPTAPLPPARALACNPLGAVFGMAGELLACGKARFERGELEAARAELAAAVQRSTEREVVREARYWLAEALWRLGRPDLAEPHFRLVVQDDPRGELGFHAAHSLGWLRLIRGDAAQAQVAFEPLLRTGAPPEIVPLARHGRALAVYAQGRHAEARDEWMALLGRSLPRALAVEASFWLGETLGRLGDAQGAVARLGVFAAAGTHPLMETALLRLGWWRRAAGQPLEAIKGLRGLLAAYPATQEAAWARTGLALALLDVGDWPGAVEEARRLGEGDRQGALAGPVWLALARWAAESGRRQDAAALSQDMLGRPLSREARAWVLVLAGETARRAGQTGEARSHFELARGGPAPEAVEVYAGLRLAQMDLDARDFARARSLAEGLLGQPGTPEGRAAAAIVAAEAAYGAGDQAGAAALYARFLGEWPGRPEAPEVLLSLGWAEYRRGRLPEAREHWERFAGRAPPHPRAAEAWLLAAELAATGGDEAQAARLLRRVLDAGPSGDLGVVAGLNHAVLALRAGQAARALDDLTALGPRAALSPYSARLRLARGVALLALHRHAEAHGEFRLALGEGEEAARLGLGVAELAARRWPEAERQLAAARGARGGAAAVLADYALAAAAFNQGRLADFQPQAVALLARGDVPPDLKPHLALGLAVLAAQERRWDEGRRLALALQRETPRHAAAPHALAAVAAAAAREGRWLLVRELYQRLQDGYPEHPGNRQGQIDFAEALLRTGAAGEARGRLGAFVQLATADPRLPRALLLLAQAHEALGERQAALDLYARIRRDHPGEPGRDTAQFSQGRLLLVEGRWAEARPLLLAALRSPDPAAVAEAAYLLGEGWRAAGRHQDAVEFYMTAAYVAPDLSWARRALLGAGQSLAALKERQAAAIVYRKILAAAGVEPELAEAARTGLTALGGD